MTLAAAGVAALGALLWAIPASAEPTLPPTASSKGPDARAAAEALFQEGLRLYEAGELASACQKLEASSSLDLAVGTLLHLGDCYERLGRTASAWARFREARSLAQAQDMAERERMAAVRADALEPKLTRLVIRVGDVPALLELSLGGTSVPRASWGSAMPVDPGWLVLEAKAPGYVTLRRHIHVPAREGARIGFELPALLPEQPPATLATAARVTVPVRRTAPPRAVEPDDTGTTARAVGIGLTLVGAAGLGSAGVLALLAGRRHQDSMQYCPDDPRLCTERGVELRSKATRFADYATASAAVGGALVASGLVVYALAPDGRPRERVAVLALPSPTTRTWALQARGWF